MSDFRITISSPPEREQLVADLFYGRYQWLLISEEQGPNSLQIEFYHYPEIGNWKFNYDAAIESIRKAQRKLLSIDGLDIRPPRSGLGKFSTMLSQNKVQILYDNQLFIELFSDLTMEFFPHPASMDWNFSIDEMWNALDEAKRVLEASPDS